ncbi:MAG: hypothetical protein EP330_13775 [Deltaproteobacteria bacterium]|nr:MAG: hypothetical protein EP330_13775 [Deltaproteobacteria bacterium]
MSDQLMPAHLRLLLGGDAPVSIGEVADLLGMAEAAAASLVEGLTFRVGNVDLVLWGDVVRAVRQPAPVVWLSTAEAAVVLGCGRGALDAVAAASHAARPDAVIQVGQGTSRRTYRWRQDLLPEALAAGQSFEVQPLQAAEVKRKPRGGRKKNRDTGKSLHDILREELRS